jgi:hypothetical protein
MKPNLYNTSVSYEAWDVTLRKKGGGGWTDEGEFEGETLTDTLVRMAIQPAVGDKMLDLPEGERIDVQYFFWAPENCGVKKDDLILYIGASFRVKHLWPRPDGHFIRGTMVYS